MPRQVLELTGLGGEGWRGAAPVDPALIEGGATAYLRHIRRNGSSLQVRLSATAGDRPEDAGPAFTAALETSARAFTFADGTDTLVLKGPGHEDNTFADETEPYFWTPGNTAEFAAWFGSTRQDFTLTLDDGVLEHAVRGAADARTGVRAWRVCAARGAAAAGEAVALASLRVAEAAALYRRALRESAPSDRLLTALEISHPAVARPVRVINDTQGRRIAGNDYAALRFDARLADDIAGRAPQAELAIDNVGREITQWVEAAQGGVGATVRVMQVLDIDDPPVEWELTMDVAGMAIDQERITATLGFDPLLGNAAVTLRHDPQTSPGLF